MEEKIAVRCQTEKLWDEVRNKLDPEHDIGFDWSVHKERSCFKLDYFANSSLSICKNDGYKIISAEAYLKEGEVEEFKKGDKIECIEPTGASKSYSLPLGSAYIISGFRDDCIKLKGESGAYSRDRFKLINKPKSKENKMNINSSIRTVLVDENGATFDIVEKFQKVFGDEIDENFTGAMILRKNITMYTDEIKRLDDIEAKRLEEEAKADK